MRILITGINGFIGYWLTQHLLNEGQTVFGVSRTSNAIDKRVKMYQGNVLDQSELKRIVQQSKPHVIYHLAAQSNIPYSFSNPQETVNVNINGTLTVLECVRLICPKARLISVGSSAEYGWTAQSNQLLKEDAELRPSSPYAITKVAQGNLVQMYRKGYGLRCTHVRPFAIIGPRKTKDAVSDFARGIVAVERGKKKTIAVGDISQTRDFMDVRDAVRALAIVAEKGTSLPVVNICSGKGTTLAAVLQQLLPFAKTKVIIRKDSERKRAIEDSVLVGDPHLLQSLGFTPAFPMQKTLGDTLAYVRREENSL